MTALVLPIPPGLFPIIPWSGIDPATLPTSLSGYGITIGAHEISLGNLATISDQTILGNISGVPASPSQLSVTQVRTFLGLGSAAYTASTAYDPAGSAAAITLGGLGGVTTTDPRLSDARPASDVYAWAKAATKPTYTYTEVGADVAGAAAAITLAGLGGVPTTRTVNGHALSANVTVSIADVFSATQTANTIFAGPTTGAAAAPTFRALVAADLGTTLLPQFAQLGIGTTCPVYAGTYISRVSINSASVGAMVGEFSTHTTNSTDYNYLLDLEQSISISSGVNVSANSYGIHHNSLRNYATVVAGGDSGTLQGFGGCDIGYGHYNITPGETPVTTTVWGLILKGRAKTGTIGTLYDIYISPLETGGTVGVHWGFYQADNAPNYFGGTIQALRAGVGVAPDALAALNVSGCTIFGGAAYDATRSLVVNGNVRVSDQSNAVAIITLAGTPGTTRTMFQAENTSVWTPTTGADATLQGFYSAPKIAPTGTTFSSSAIGISVSPQVVSSDVGARLSLIGVNSYILRNTANDISSYASNGLTGLLFGIGHYLGPPGTIVTGTATAISCGILNFNGTITAATGYDLTVSVGNAGGAANPVIGTLYGLRLRAPTLAHGGTITTEWGVSQESTTAKNVFAGSVTTAAFGCNGATAQTAYASGGAAPAGGTGATAGAYDTAAHRDSLITLVNKIRTALVNNGIMS